MSNEEPSHAEKRDAPRKHVRWNALLIADDAPQTRISCTVEDVSITWLSLLVPRQLRNGARCTVHALLPPSAGNQHMTLRAEVVYTILVGRVSAFRTGMKIVEIAPDQMERLQRALDA